jgi:hypothetical protein
MVDLKKIINSEQDGEKALQRILGARLTSVQFVLDYLILGFDEKGALTSLVWPEIVQSDGVTKHGSLEYRNLLCGLIESVVRETAMQADDTIEVKFNNSTKLRIPLGTYVGTGERAILTAPKHFLSVF